MSNVLKVSLQEAIRCLHQKGWGQRRIARELGVHRNTVKGYVEGGSKCTTHSTTGSAAIADPKCTSISTAGSGGDNGERCHVGSIEPKPGRRSLCEPFGALVEAKVEAGLSAQCVYQDLVTEHGFKDSYESVKRYVRKLKAKAPARVWRIECNPGEEAQVDFGLGAPIVDEQGKRTRTWVLRVVLSHSRKGYSEGVLRQDTETFLRVPKNAIRSFVLIGGGA